MHRGTQLDVVRSHPFPPSHSSQLSPCVERPAVDLHPRSWPSCTHSQYRQFKIFPTEIVFDVDGIFRAKWMARDKFASALKGGFGFCDRGLCVCDPGYEGDECETDTDGCDGAPHGVFALHACDTATDEALEFAPRSRTRSSCSGAGRRTRRCTCSSSSTT